MKPQWRAADRAAALLAAARTWRAAGLIDQTTLASITAGESPPGPRLGPIWRILVFLCVVIGVSTATAVAFFSFGLREATEVGCTFLLSGLALAALTEVVVDRCSYRPTGAEAATSLLATAYVCAAAFVLLDNLHLSWPATLRLASPWCAAVLALAAWRWGFRLYAGAAAVCLLLLGAQLPAARAAWIGSAVLLAVWAHSAGKRELAPSHRECVGLVRLVAFSGVYAAVNYHAVDRAWIEELSREAGAPHHHPGEFSLLLAGLGTALYPPALLVAGLRKRDRLLIDLGLIAAALSSATALARLAVQPRWMVLAAAGAALVVAALALERWLRSGRDGERRGFTAAPLDDPDRRERLLPVAPALAPTSGEHARSSTSPDAGGRQGSFGGGGADGRF